MTIQRKTTHADVDNFGRWKSRDAFERFRRATVEQWRADPILQLDHPDLAMYLRQEIFIASGAMGVRILDDEGEGKAGLPWVNSGAMGRQTIEDYRRELAEEARRPAPTRENADAGSSTVSMNLADVRPGDNVELFAPTGQLQLTAGAPVRGGKCFEGVAYSGDLVRWSGKNLVIDLEELQVPRGKVWAFRDHDPKRVAGFVESLEKRNGELHVSGKLLDSTADGREALEFVEQGLDEFGLSIGVDPIETRAVAANEFVEVNERTFSGPLSLITKSRLRELSFVPIPADAGASATVS